MLIHDKMIYHILKVSFSPLEEVQIYSPQQDSGGSEESDSEEEDFVYIRQQVCFNLSSVIASRDRGGSSEGVLGFWTPHPPPHPPRAL